MYKLYDSVCYSYGEPLVPFTLIGNFTTLVEIIEIINKNKDIRYFVFDNNNNNNEVKI